MSTHLLRVWLLLATVAFSAAVVTVNVDAEQNRPNILVILCDDLGYGDLACYGNDELITPNVDQLAREGLRLTSCYAAAANCSPARTGLMTGRTPTRVGVNNWIPMFSPVHVKREEITVATLLRNAGYDTGHFGKWHLNGDFNLPSQPQPSDHGFNHWFSTQNNALPNHRNPNNFVRNGNDVGPLDGYAGPLVTDEAIAWLQNVRDESKPFFMFVCYHEPHEPIASDKKYTDLYPHEDPSYSAHHGNITQMDAACGKLLKTIDELGLRDDTFVLFTSDNGPAITGYHPHGSPGPFREKKGHLYEGGIRVPGIVRWPGHTKAGQESDEPVSGVDLLPTLCELAGIHAPQDRVLDGASFLPVVAGKAINRSRPLYWHFLRASSEPKVAMRDGDWKLLARLDGPPLPRGADLLVEEMEKQKTAKLEGFELYNLKDDPSETKDLAAARPELVNRLASKMQRVYKEVQAESPVWPAWKWPRYESQRIEWPAYSKRRRAPSRAK